MEKILKKNKVLVTYIKNYNPEKYNYFCWMRLTRGMKACHDLFASAYTNPFAKEKTRKVYFPTEMTDFLGRALQCNRSVDLLSILKWNLELFISYSEKINDYLVLRSEYEKLLYVESYMEAWNKLSEIETKCGYSLWLIKQQFGVLSCLGEYEDQGQMLFQRYRDICKNVVTVNLLMGMYNQKNLDLGIEDYSKVLDGLLANYKETSLGYRYLKRKLSFHVEENNELDYNIMLQIDECYSMIDLYESFIDVCVKMMCQGENQEIYYLMLDLNCVIKDFRIKNIIVKQSGSTEILAKTDRSELAYEIIEKYSLCRRQEAIEILNNYLDLYPDDFMMNQLLIKCCLLENKRNDIESELNHILLDLYIMPNNLSKIGIKIEKYIKIFMGTKYYYKLLIIWNSKIKGRESEFANLVGRCMDEVVTPSFAYAIQKEKQKNFLLNFAEQCQSTIEIMLYQFGYIETEPLLNDEIKNAFVKMCYLDSKGEDRECINVGCEIISKMYEEGIQDELSFYYNLERISRRIFSGYIKTNCIEEAINLYGKMYMQRKSTVKRWNLKMLMEVINKFYSDDKDISFFKSIFTTIIFEHFYGKSHPDEIIIAYRQFLYYQDKQSLIEWIEAKETLSNLERYFLNNVCTVEVLKRDYLSMKKFRSVSELRVFILRKLLESEFPGSKKCIEELNIIYSKQRMENHKKNIYKDKIHIDIDNIRGEMNQFLESEFERYQLISELRLEIGSTNVNLIEEQTDSEKEVVFNDFSIGKYLSEQSFYLYIIQEIVSNYLTNKLYGLDVYLGTRMRHVYCQQKLFSLFENHDLISKKETDTSENYGINPYWVNIIKNEKDLKIVIEILDYFSRKMNDMLHKITGEWLQIKKNEDEEGWFDYADVSQKIYDYSHVVKNSCELVFETVIESMNKITTNLLTGIRKNIKEELDTFFHAQLSELRSKLQKSALNPTIIEEIKQRITICSNEIGSIIDEFCNYFYLHEVSYNNFQLSDAFKCNIDIFSELYLDFSEKHIDSKIDIDANFEGKYFPYWVDINGILFQNAIEHSKCHDYKKMKMQFLITKVVIGQAEKIKIEVSNNVNYQKDSELQEKRDRIENAIKNIDDNLFLEKSSLECGSGLYKIARIVKYNFNETADYSGGIDDNGKFTYTIIFPYKRMEVNK